jgi:long-chain acyl-CoA synthetase
VVLAPNHQSHVDTPLIISALPARFRFRVAVVIWQEYFDAHFFPQRHKWRERLVQGFVYNLVALLFNVFPLPQTEAGARESLRHIGDLVSEGWSILFFPEGERTEAGEVRPFQPGIGLIAGRLAVPIVPVRIRGAERVLHRTKWLPRPGRVDLNFGPPLYLKGTDYAALAKQVEEAVLAL